MGTARPCHAVEATRAAVAHLQTADAPLPSALCVPASAYKDMLKGDPKLRPTASQVLERLSVRGGYLTNDFVQASIFMETFALKDAHEKDQFFRRLGDAIDSFPLAYTKHKILPELLHALEFGNGASTSERAMRPPSLPVADTWCAGA